MEAGEVYVGAGVEECLDDGGRAEGCGADEWGIAEIVWGVEVYAVVKGGAEFGKISGGGGEGEALLADGEADGLAEEGGGGEEEGDC